MLFCSSEFLAFFVCVFGIYWALPWHRGRVLLLLGASFVFYASWNQWLAGLICLSTLLDYLVARGLDALGSLRWRRLLLGISLVANLGLLVYFKYANFFLGSLARALHALGAESSLPVLSIILPVGISFYTFEAINYTVDVYRRRIPAERDLAHFMLFILFFPHLIAGPIVRARDFLPQVARRKRWNWARLNWGVQLFLLGLFKKVAIADRMALLADPVFQEPEQYGTSAVWIAVVAYAVQIYCDFSGYSDMALGTAHILGYKLVQNFNMPYLAGNIADFWHRWHISLSTWLRDYLFIPLGGSRGSTRQTQRNLLVTMMLGGLWHGASWTFVLWGLFHGILLVLHRVFRAFCEARPRLERVMGSRPALLGGWALTLLLVMLGWVLFRAETFAQCLSLCARLFVPQRGLGSAMAELNLWLALAALAAGHLVGHFRLWQRFNVHVPAAARGVSYASLLSLVLLLSPSAHKAFVYFQF
jgi:alginate O-acetyltransferase complex protein AlgI